MWKALFVKELRQSLWITLPAILAYMVFILEITHVPIVPEVIREFNRDRYMYQEKGIPFVSDQIYDFFGRITGIFAVALGFWQSMGEERQGTYAIMLHLPLNRRHLLGFKLFWGLMCVFGLGASVLFILSVWAATPGTHPSPFYWSMTLPCWGLLMASLLLYLGAFVSGLRPARWFGTKLFPLLLAIALVLPFTFTTFGLTLFWLISVIGFLWVINFIIQERDFS